MHAEALERRDTSAQEIAEIRARLEVARRDARVVEQSADGRYVDAYTAGYLLAKLVVRASGYRVKGGENHLDTLRAIPWLMGSESQSSVDALEAARRRRNTALYDAAGTVGDDDLEALLRRVDHFDRLVTEWLGREHPELVG